MSGYVSPWKDTEVRALGAVADKFVAEELTGKRERWEAQHYVDRYVWRRAGDLGLLCCSVPEEYGRRGHVRPRPHRAGKPGPRGSRLALSGQLFRGAKRWAPLPPPPRPSSVRYVPALCHAIRMKNGP